LTIIAQIAAVVSLVFVGLIVADVFLFLLDPGGLLLSALLVAGLA
jgi:hypothetical protein